MNGRPKTLGTKSDIAMQVANETDRMLDLARRVGKRLRHRLVMTADTRSLPDEEWVETAKWYSRCVIELRRFLATNPEQPDDNKPMSTADYERELLEIRDEKLREMTPAERRELLQRIEHEPGGGSVPATLNPAPDRWNQ